MALSERTLLSPNSRRFVFPPIPYFIETAWKVNCFSPSRKIRQTFPSFLASGPKSNPLNIADLVRIRLAPYNIRLKRISRSEEAFLPGDERRRLHEPRQSAAAGKNSISEMQFSTLVNSDWEMEILPVPREPARQTDLGQADPRSGRGSQLAKGPQ